MYLSIDLSIYLFIYLFIYFCKTKLLRKNKCNGAAIAEFSRRPSCGPTDHGFLNEIDAGQEFHRNQHNRNRRRVFEFITTG